MSPRDRRPELEGIVKDIGRRLAELVGVHTGVGFAFVVYDFGEKGDMAYVANGKRADVVKLLRELARELEGDA